MFESAELGHKVSKERWDQEVPALREALLDAQYDLAAANSAGKGINHWPSRGGGWTGEPSPAGGPGMV
jgi:hypothetical protein